MVLRSSAFFLLLLVCAAALSQTPDQTSAQAKPSMPKSFHDTALNITYFYPGRFVPAPAEPEGSSSDSTPKCAHSTLFANSVTPADTTSFVLSTIDNTCPTVLRGAATEIGAFVREQILRQLKQYGEPVIAQETTHYTIDGHPAAIVLATVPMPLTPEHKLPRTTYAAKVCMLGNVPVKPRKRSDPVEPTRHILCFDYTTLHSDLLNLLYSFTMQFDNGAPLPIIPGSVIR